MTERLMAFVRGVILSERQRPPKDRDLVLLESSEKLLVELERSRPCVACGGPTSRGKLARRSLFEETYRPVDTPEEG